VTGGTRASVIIPTHDKPATLPYAVRSVLRQTVTDLEVIVVGDGVTDEVREAVGALLDEDPRVRFLDLPKGPHHGEVHRHTAILEARSEAILYLCDDDLLLADHVADLLALLDDHDLVQCWNGWLRLEGGVGLYATDLSDPDEVRAHLRTDRVFNAVSLTGTGHTRSAYLALDDPWETTPEGRWPDHYQWCKFMARDGFRGATSHRMTALQLPTSVDGRAAWTQEQRLEELDRWWQVVTQPDAQEIIDGLCHDAARREFLLQRRTTWQLYDSVWWRSTAWPRRATRSLRSRWGR
jgi:hypothetical protein